MKIGLPTLERFGLSRTDVDRLREEISSGEKLRDQFAVDGFSRADLRTIAQYAQRLEIALPTERLEAVMRPVAGDAQKLPRTPFPEVKVSMHEARTHAGSMDDVAIPRADLSRFGGLSKLLDIKKHEGDTILASELRALLTNGYGLARHHMTSKAIESAMIFASSASGPSYTERDAELNIDANLTPLGESSNRAKLYAKAAIENLFLRRSAAGEAELHGFEAEKVVVTLPDKDSSVLLVNGDGNQFGVRLVPQTMTIDGEKVRAVEIGPHLAQRSRGYHDAGVSFSLKVLDGEGNPTLEKALSFNADVGRRSKKLWTGGLGYVAKPEPELTDDHFDHFVPSPRDNGVPVGQRPQFTVGGETADRLLITRDGQKFPVASLTQLIEPKGREAFPSLLEDGKKMTFTVDRRSGKSLDDSGYDMTELARLRDSYGRPATLSPELSGSRYARWGSKGVTVFEAGTRKPIARFDPLSADLNRRRR